MVKISKDLKDLPPQERIKRLKEIEQEKKKELEKKKKEIEELEKKAKEEEEENLKELQEAEQLIQDSLGDLQEEEEKAFEELQKYSKENPNEEISLEDMVEKEQPTPAPKQIVYGQQLEEIKDAQNFYEITNYNVFKTVETLANKAVYEGLTFQEQESLKAFKNNLERLSHDDAYEGKDDSNYIQKMAKRIDDINTQLERSSDYQKKELDDIRKKQSQQDVYKS